MEVPHAKPTARSHLPDPASPSVPPPMRSPSSRWPFTGHSSAETIAFFLDETSRSNAITVVSGTTEPDAVLAVAECMARGRRQIAQLRVAWCWPRFARCRAQHAGNAAGRHRPMGRGQEDHRVARDRADRVVRRRPGGVDCPANCWASRSDGERLSAGSLLASPPFGRTPSQPGSPQAAPTGRGSRSTCAGADQVVKMFLGNIVVVPLKPTGAGSLPVRRTHAARRSSRR